MAHTCGINSKEFSDLLKQIQISPDKLNNVTKVRSYSGNIDCMGSALISLEIRMCIKLYILNPTHLYTVYGYKINYKLVYIGFNRATL